MVFWSLETCVVWLPLKRENYIRQTLSVSRVVTIFYAVYSSTAFSSKGLHIIKIWIECNQFYSGENPHKLVAPPSSPKTKLCCYCCLYAFEESAILHSELDSPNRMVIYFSFLYHVSIHFCLGLSE
jgi:hypothetical protein